MKNKIIGILCIYIIFIFIYVDNNSNLEILFKILVLSIMILFLNKDESKKIFFISYCLFFISYCLFFISYFLVDSESSKYLTSFLFIIVSLLFPMYSLVSINMIRIDYKLFLKYNSVFLFVICIYFLRNNLGFESGINSMVYTSFDIFLFMLSLSQFVISIYFFKKEN